MKIKREKVKKNHTSLKARMLLVFGSVGLAVCVIYVFAGLLILHRSTTLALEQSLVQEATAYSTAISNEIELYKTQIRGIAPDSRISSKATTATWEQIRAGYRDYYGLTDVLFVDADGNTCDGLANVAERDYFTHAMAGETYISSPLMRKVDKNDGTDGTVVMFVSTPVTNGNYDGIVAGAFPCSTFNDVINEVKIGKLGYAFVLDRDGDIVMHPDQGVVDNLTNYINLVQTDPSCATYAQLSKQIISSDEGSILKYDANGYKQWLYYVPIDGTDGWKLCVIVNHTEQFAQFKMSEIMLLVISLFCLIYMLSVAFLSGGHLVTPILLMSNRLSKLGKGDLITDVPEFKRRDEIGMLRQSVKEMVDSLTMHMQALNRVGENVLQSSKQQSSGAQQLAQGSAEQASAVEELVTTINDISSRVTSNASHTADMSNKIYTAKERLLESNNAMESLTQAMDEINETSSRISEVSNRIEKIVFQTNILAVNAAVVASRAGESGKEFAVIAGEVRNLANECSEAATTTQALTQNTIRSISNGLQLTKNTAEHIQSTVSVVDEITDIVAEISTASNEQADAIEQVVVGLDQVSIVVQDNSVTAQNTAAHSEQLAEWAEELMEHVDAFQFEKAEAE